MSPKPAAWRLLVEPPPPSPTGPSRGAYALRDRLNGIHMRQVPFDSVEEALAARDARAGEGYDVVADVVRVDPDRSPAEWDVVEPAEDDAQRPDDTRWVIRTEAGDITPEDALRALRR